MQRSNQNSRQKFDIGRFDFLSLGKYFVSLTIIVVVVGILNILFGQGLNYGIDFAGGVEIQVKFEKPIKDDDLRSLAADLGYKDASVQRFGGDNEFLVRFESPAGKDENDTTQKINQLITAVSAGIKEKLADAGPEIRRSDSVGPAVGESLKKNSLLAAFYCIIVILAYMAFRFDLRYAPSAVVCSFHDAVVVLAIFSFTQREVSMQTIAAIMTVMGYSLNDTIVTFDRIRENLRIFPDESLYNIVNRSINDTLGRTMKTAGATFMSVAALYFFTDGVIREIAFTLAMGTIFGAYSTVYVASPLVILTDRFLQKREAARHKAAAMQARA